MHEFSLMADLMRKIESIARQENASRIRTIHVRLGALCHMSPEHFCEHFQHAARGTVAEGAALKVTVHPDPHDAHAQDVLLESVEVES